MRGSIQRFAGTIATLGFACVGLGTAPALANGLSQQEQLVVDAVAGDAPWSLRLLENLVAINSGSENSAGVRAVADRVSSELTPLGFGIEYLPGGRISTLHCPTNQNPDIHTAPHLLAQQRGGRGRRLLLSAHMDTVFEPDSGFLDAVRQGDRLIGPGVVDCKGGIVVMLSALRALHWGGYLDDRTITIVLNSDEELGSLTSGPLLEREAGNHDAALVFEGGQLKGHATTVTTQRKGLGQFRVVVEGQAAHAGVHHERGANALEELAGHILAIQALTDYETGTTLNVGNVECPGCKRNIVPNCAEAEVDLRYVSREHGHNVERFFRTLGTEPRVRAQATGESTRTIADGVLHRPPWNPDAGSMALRDLLLRVGDDLGQHLTPVSSGGGSDANLIAAAGCPTLDGVGAVGGGFHTHEEWVLVESLTTRAQLAAIVMMRLLASE